MEFNGPSGSLTLTNTTVTGNTATTDGGGIFFYPGATVGVNLVNSTITDNTASGSGGNIYNGGVGSYNDYIAVGNTIVSGGSPTNCSGTVWSRWGYNLESANTCGFSAAGDKRNINPNLTSLQDNTGRRGHACRFRAARRLTRAPTPSPQPPTSAACLARWTATATGRRSPTSARSRR